MRLIHGDCLEVMRGMLALSGVDAVITDPPYGIRADEAASKNKQKASRCITYARGKALRDGRFHPTQKPIEVMAESINYLRLPPNSLILDPFMGSGTTGVAAVMAGHRFIGIEREAAYVGIAERRIAEAESQLTLGVA